MYVREIMKASPHCVSDKDDAKTAASKMKEHNIGFLPVCDGDGRVIGAVTDRDLAIRLVAQDMPASTSIGDVMTREVVCVGPDAGVQEAERRMAREHKSRIFVVGDDGKLVGVVSLSDIAQHESPALAAQTLKDVTSREVSP